MHSILALIFIVIGLSLLAQNKKSTAATQPRQKITIGPTIPNRPRIDGNKVFLEHADVLHKNDADSFMVVSGNVKFSKGPMLMYCDSAHYFPASESMDAFGNVRMEQGDTLFIYADELNFRGGSHEVAYLYGYEGKPVRMINRDVKLETDIFTYDLLEERGYYTTGGVLTDPTNRLESIEGEYLPATKQANFFHEVWLKRIDGRDTLDIYTDTLNYNTVTHIAEFYSNTDIRNNRGTIKTNAGVYNTVNNQSELFARSTVETSRGTTLTADTLVYDRDAGWAQGFGNVSLVDSIRQSSLHGSYGYYDQKLDSAFFTGHAEAREYSRGDTLYIHGHYLFSILRIDTVHIDNKIPSDSTVTSSQHIAGVIDPDSALYSRQEIEQPKADTLPEHYQLTSASIRTDSTHVISAWPRVRFYRSDIQGLCDSMTFVQHDSLLTMDRHPIVWSDDRQIFGNRIVLHLNDSTVDHALLPDFGFTAQHIEDDFYNQLTGKEMEAWFDNGELSQLNVSNSVEAIFYPEENDSTINKLVNLQTANMHAWFEKRAMIKLKCWPQTTGQTVPLYLAKKSMLLLSKFQWFETLRPEDPDDIFTISEEMNSLMENAPIPYIPIPSAPDMLAAPLVKPIAPTPVILTPVSSDVNSDNNGDSNTDPDSNGDVDVDEKNNIDAN